MHVISRQQIYDFIEKHADARDPLLSWYHETCNATWSTPHEIKARYSSASFLGNNVVVFNIKGNTYRLVTKVAYQTQYLTIVWIGTHAEYDKKKF